MLPAKIKNFLLKNKIKHDILKHKTVFTAYDLANTLKKKLNEVAKTLVIRVDKGHVLVVLPASHQVDFKALKKILKAKKIDIDRENVMVKLFKVKAGALSAIHGRLNKIPVYVDKSLTKAKKIVAQAGSFEESLHLTAKDFIKAVEGQLASFSKKK
ncbi:TPA: hypothetical protein DEB72_01080 [Patescibacteria group bacterium]|nr:hypothetical protein [Patescibacteria group bacterium]